MILQFAFVLTAIIVGARLGGIGLGVMGGIGLGILTFVFGLQPTTPPIDVMLMIVAVITAAACMQAAGGLDLMVRGAEHLLRKRPAQITFLSPLVTYFFSSRNRPCRLFCSSGHCRSSPGNQNTPRTSFRNSCHRFPASHYSQSDLCGYRCPFGTFNRIQYLFARYPDHYNSIHAMRRLSRSFVFAKGR